MALAAAPLSQAFTTYYGPANADPSVNYSTPGYNNRYYNDDYNNTRAVGVLLQIWEKHTDGSTVGSAVGYGDVFATHSVQYTQSFCGNADGYYLLMRCQWG